ncbi:MAG: phosphoribosylformylglycinamidine synthase subunit PurQ, partial [Bacteroidales bacterium]
ISKGMIIAGHDISAGGLITTLLEMCFSNTTGGLAINLESKGEDDTVKLLFSQNPGVVIQVADEASVEEFLLERGISCFLIGHPVSERKIFLKNGGVDYVFDIDELRDKWLRTSYLLDRKQSGDNLALERYRNFGKTPLNYVLKDFEGTSSVPGIDPERRELSGVRAAIIREKGVNGDREMAYALWLAGFDVKDVHMTDLVTGKETLEDISMIVFVGGFSNSDVLGSAKGWAGAFRYNEKARIALERFYARKDTLSLGVCNGCQLMAELGLIYPDHKDMPKLLHNRSHKFESAFLGVRVSESPSVMLQGLEGMELGIWIAHGEGRFSFPYETDRYHIPVRYSHSGYPANPNGSDHDAAAVCSADGRHLAIMPHLERTFMPWQCAYYPADRLTDEVTPWMKAFVNAFKWCKLRA